MMRQPDRRILNRLRFQYGRWALTHNVLPFLRRHGWHRIIRPLRRDGHAIVRCGIWFASTATFRVGMVLFAILVGLAMLACAVLLIAWIPVLLANGQFHADLTSTESDRMLRNAWLRLSIVLSYLILVLELGMPLADVRRIESSTPANQKNARNRYRSRMRCPPKYFWTARRLTVLIVITLVISVLVASQLLWRARLSGEAFAIAMVALLIGVVVLGYIVRQTALALQAVRVPARWVVACTIGRVSFSFGSLFAVVLIVFNDRLIQPDGLPWCGPIGVSADCLHEVAGGRYVMLVPIAGMLLAGVLFGAGIGYLLERNSFRRRIARARRRNVLFNDHFSLECDRLVGTVDSASDSHAVSLNSLQQQIRMRLNQRNVGQHFFAWRSWIVPDWFRRRLVWYWVTIIPVLLMMVPIVSVHWMFADLSATEVIGSAVGSNDQSFPVLEELVGMLIAFVILGSEVVANFDTAFCSSRRLAQRPILVIGEWWHRQLDGVRRLPLQIILALPVVAIASSTIARTDQAICFRFMLAMGIGLIVIRTIAVNFEQTLGSIGFIGNGGRFWYPWLHGLLFFSSGFLLAIGMAFLVSQADTRVLISAVTLTTLYLLMLNTIQTGSSDVSVLRSQKV